MTTSGISQTGIQSNLVNQQMNELKQQTQFKAEKGKGDSPREIDIVKITANITDSPAMEFDALNEEDALILSQLVANDLGRQSFGMSTQAGMEALKTFL